MTSYPAPMCVFCKWYSRDLTCAAFPSGIPEPILHSMRLHERPYPEDQGYRYEVAPGREQEAAEYRKMQKSNIERTGGTPLRGRPGGQGEK